MKKQLSKFAMLFLVSTASIAGWGMYYEYYAKGKEIGYRDATSHRVTEPKDYCIGGTVFDRDSYTCIAKYTSSSDCSDGSTTFCGGLIYD